MTNRFITKPNKTLEEIGGLNAANRGQVEYNKNGYTPKVEFYHRQIITEGLDGIIDKFTIPVAVPENFEESAKSFNEAVREALNDYDPLEADK